MSTGAQSTSDPPAGYLPALRFRFLTPVFDTVVRAMREQTFKAALVEQAALRRGHRVLDLGAGTGTLAITAQRHQPDSVVVGLDADPAIVELARAKAAEAEVEVRFDEGLATRLPYEDGSFDRVLSTLFFHHLTPDDKLAALHEVRRVLRPGGELHLGDFTAAADPLQWALFWMVRLFDGLELTRDHAAGRLPGLIAEAGLSDVREHDRLRTCLGTLGLFSARR